MLYIGNLEKAVFQNRLKYNQTKDISNEYSTKGHSNALANVKDLG